MSPKLFDSSANNQIPAAEEAKGGRFCSKSMLAITVGTGDSPYLITLSGESHLSYQR